MECFLCRISRREHHFTRTINKMNTLLAAVTVLDVETTNCVYSDREFRHARSQRCFPASDIG